MLSLAVHTGSKGGKVHQLLASVNSLIDNPNPLPFFALLAVLFMLAAASEEHFGPRSEKDSDDPIGMT